MKLILEFKDIRLEQPVPPCDLMVLTPTTWDIIFDWDGSFPPADVTHWAYIDVSKLEI